MGCRDATEARQRPVGGPMCVRAKRKSVVVTPVATTFSCTDRVSPGPALLLSRPRNDDVVGGALRDRASAARPSEGPHCRVSHRQSVLVLS